MGRSINLLTRAAVMTVGAALSTVCYAATLRARLGLGPLYAVQDGFAKHLGISLGHAVMVVGVITVILSMLVRSWPGVGTLALPFMMGWMLDAVLPHLPHLHGLVVRLVVVVVASWLSALGGALIIAATLGASALDALMLGLARVSAWPIRRTRLSMEATMLVMGLLLGGAVGVGTVISGVLIGPGLHFWLNIVDQKDAEEVHIAV